MAEIPLPPGHSLDTLPPEILLRIYAYLDGPSLFAVCATSHRNYELAHDVRPSLWNRVLNPLHEMCGLTECNSLSTLLTKVDEADEGNHLRLRSQGFATAVHSLHLDPCGQQLIVVLERSVFASGSTVFIYDFREPNLNTPIGRAQLVLPLDTPPFSITYLPSRKIFVTTPLSELHLGLRVLFGVHSRYGRHYSQQTTRRNFQLGRIWRFGDKVFFGFVTLTRSHWTHLRLYDLSSYQHTGLAPNLLTWFNFPQVVDMCCCPNGLLDLAVTPDSLAQVSFTDPISQRRETLYSLDYTRPLVLDPQPIGSSEVFFARRYDSRTGMVGLRYASDLVRSRGRGVMHYNYNNFRPLFGSFRPFHHFLLSQPVELELYLSFPGGFVCCYPSYPEALVFFHLFANDDTDTRVQNVSFPFPSDTTHTPPSAQSIDRS